MILAIAAGGAIGAVCRHGVNSLFVQADFPYATIIVNVLGSMLMGLCVGLFAHYGPVDQNLRGFLTIGLLGAFTTFSTFSMEAVLLYERGQLLQSAGYISINVIASIMMFFIGLFLIRQIVA